MASANLLRRAEQGQHAGRKHDDLLRSGVADHQPPAAGGGLLPVGDDHPRPTRAVAVHPPHTWIVRVQHRGDVGDHRSHIGRQLRQAADQHGIPKVVDAAGRGPDVIFPLPAHGAGLCGLSPDPPAGGVGPPHDLVPVLSWHAGCLLDGTGGVLRGIAGLLPRHLQLSALLRADLDVSLPVLGLPESIARLPREVLTIIKINPMYSMLGGYTELIQEGTIPDLYMWLTSAAWALGVAAIGFLFFISREREFAVRLN